MIAMYTSRTSLNTCWTWLLSKGGRTWLLYLCRCWMWLLYLLQSANLICVSTKYYVLPRVCASSGLSLLSLLEIISRSLAPFCHLNLISYAVLCLLESWFQCRRKSFVSQYLVLTADPSLDLVRANLIPRSVLFYSIEICVQVAQWPRNLVISVAVYIVTSALF